MTTEEKQELVRVVPLPEGMTRMESGPVQFGGEDWPGYFFRGDDAFGLIRVLKQIAMSHTSDDIRDFVIRIDVNRTMGNLWKCILIDDEE